jgi:hypothetical protein
MRRGRPSKSTVIDQDKSIDEFEIDDRTLADYPMSDRQNADKLIGRKALVQLGQQYGMLICQMMAWPLDKLRQQIKCAQTAAIWSEQEADVGV